MTPLAVSQEVQSAEAQLERANSLVKQSRSQVLPQLSAALSCTRQLASIYETDGAAIPAFEPDTTASLEDRARTGRVRRARAP